MTSTSSKDELSTWRTTHSRRVVPRHGRSCLGPAPRRVDFPAAKIKPETQALTPLPPRKRIFARRLFRDAVVSETLPNFCRRDRNIDMAHTKMPQRIHDSIDDSGRCAHCCRFSYTFGAQGMMRRGSAGPFPTWESLRLWAANNP